jgi:hypothetical protein
MSNPTSNFGWVMPTNTDLVTDLPADFAVFGQAVDTSMADLLGGTTGQILSKASGTNMDFTWVAANPGDITGVTAGTGISGGGTSGTVTVSIDTSITADLTTAQTLTTKTLTAPKINLAFNAQASSYTLVAADSGKLVSMSSTSAVALTLPPSVFAAGEQINVIATGATAAMITITQGSGVTILSTGATASAPKLRVQYSAATIICQTGGATPTFYVVGDLA